MHRWWTSAVLPVEPPSLFGCVERDCASVLLHLSTAGSIWRARPVRWHEEARTPVSAEPAGQGDSRLPGTTVKQTRDVRGQGPEHPARWHHDPIADAALMQQKYKSLSLFKSYKDLPLPAYKYYSVLEKITQVEQCLWWSRSKSEFKSGTSFRMKGYVRAIKFSHGWRENVVPKLLVVIKAQKKKKIPFHLEDWTPKAIMLNCLYN